MIIAFLYAGCADGKPVPEDSTAPDDTVEDSAPDTDDTGPDTDPDDTALPAECGGGVAAHVDDRGYPTLEDAVDAAPDGATVHVCQGAWGVSLTLTRDVSLVGEMASLTVLFGGVARQVLRVEDADVRLSGLSIESGVGSQEADATEGFTRGGGILLRGGSLTATDVQISGNTAAEGAGLYAYGGTVELTDVIFRENVASMGGGGLMATDGAVVACHACTFERNDAAGMAGGLWVAGATVRLDEGTIVRGSTVEAFGGGVLLGGGGTLVLDGATITQNVVTGTDPSYGGGGISILQDAVVTATDSVVMDNEAERGGGVQIWQRGSVSGLRVEGNRATIGGGFHVDSLGATLTDVVVTANTATAGGGLAFDGFEAFVIEGGAVTDNVAETGGGLYLLAGTVAFTAVDFTGNVPDDVTTPGGSTSGLGASATVTCTVAGCE